MGIETKLAPGEYIELPLTGAQKANGVVSLGCTRLSIKVSKKVSGYDATTRRIEDGYNPKEKKSHRNFVWLPWSVGAVNYTEQEGKDVLSGRFSGCYMIRYKLAGGSWRVAHVDTPGGITAWNALAQANGFEISGGFKPYQEANVAKYGAAPTYGIITDTGVCYRLIVAPVAWDKKTGANSIYSKILEVSAVESLSADQLRVLAAK